jgi:hypothetical protein
VMFKLLLLERFFWSKSHSSSLKKSLTRKDMKNWSLWEPSPNYQASGGVRVMAVNLVRFRQEVSQRWLRYILPLIDIVQAGIRNGNAANAQHATALIAKHSTTRWKHVNNINALNKLTAKVSKRSWKQRKAVPSVAVWEEWRSTSIARTHFAK